MRISRLLELLHDCVAQHGDMEVGCIDHEYGAYHVAEFAIRHAHRGLNEKNEFRDDQELGDRFLGVS